MNLRLLFFFLSGLVSASCNTLPEAKDPAILSGVPTMADVADSLNRVSAGASKWSVVGGDSIVYSNHHTIDWVKEFQAFLKDDVNKQRFADAYIITDAFEAGVRTVVFQAASPSQEIKSVKILLDKGRVTHYSIIKERSNLLSSSKQLFTFNGTSYELEIEQSIKWFFDNKQFVHGDILPEGTLWRGVFQHKEGLIPIQFVINSQNELIVKNHTELLTFIPTEGKSDSSVYESEYFSSHFILKTETDSSISGRWVNEKTGASRSIKFRASSKLPYRFKPHTVPEGTLTGNHKFIFLKEDGSPEETNVLSLTQNKFTLSGSLLSETGDYRYLEGIVRSDSLFLSTMDGTHLMYFEGKVEDGRINGKFLSGSSFSQKWLAELNSTVKLSNPTDITKLNPESIFKFSFPDETGSIVSIDDEQFKNKVLLVSIMGTWCSNCLDESRFLKELYDDYSHEDLSIVSLDFELISDSLKAIENIKKYKRNLDINYPVLLAATRATKTIAAEALPSLNGIFSYPTLLLLNKKHEVVRIHTGFNGPATGEENYISFTNEYRELIVDLIRQ
ncbi:MAG TPA: hypothetical protein DCR48_00620 [Flavobacteriales bacterium]|nr:hypothetical protein [Flavobacteriales bacterium]